MRGARARTGPTLQPPPPGFTAGIAPRARRGLAAACVRSLRGSTARRRLGRKATSCAAPALQQPLRRRRNRYAPSYAYVARTRRSRRSASPGRGACRLARVKVLLCPISGRSSPARASRPGFVRCAMTQYYVRAQAAAATAAPRTRVVVRCCAPPWTGPSSSSLWVFVGERKNWLADSWELKPASKNPVPAARNLTDFLSASASRSSGFVSLSLPPPLLGSLN